MNEDATKDCMSEWPTGGRAETSYFPSTHVARFLGPYGRQMRRGLWGVNG